MERITFQNTPNGLYDGLYQMGKYIDTSGLSKSLLLLVDYHVSQLNRCAFCLDMHYKEAIEAGETSVRLSMLSAWRESEAFSEQEAAVLEFAEAVTLVANREISDQVYQLMLDHYTENEVAAWTLAIVKINCWNRFMTTFKTKAGHYQVGQFA
ncbi:MAG: carboxymuconolactone decarboxylase family protein [Reichenbachiella sp.]|uniref:carboxymuconolactone decarboxylase family protein n=1 Tax=Reichenbachiella sp. TaxID=2184521 RepID=UPI003264A1EC